MKKLIILIIALNIPIFAQDLSNMILPFSPEDVSFLRYVNIVNRFDTAFVDYTAGEFTVVSGQNKNRIPFLASFDEYSWIGGDSLQQGEDTNLMDHTKTINFTIPQNSTITFFRKMYALITCGKAGPPEDPDGGGTGDWRDMLWHCGKNRIPDKSEFVIQLVNSTNNQVVFTIDSVGVDPNPNSNIAQRYGLNNTVMNHSVAIPSNLWGTNCNIRISPRRWGPTPHGMELQMQRTSWSMSTFYEFNPTYRFFRYHDSIVKPIYDSIVAARLFPYLDSVKENTGFLPDYSNFEISDSLFNVIHALWFTGPDTVYHNNSPTLMYQEIIGSNWLKRRENIEVNPRTVKLKGLINNIYPSPVSNGNFILRYNIQEELPFAIIGLYSIDGQKISNLWGGRIKQGQGELSLQTGNCSTGLYLIIITDTDGNRLDLAKILIE
jgi:hypothetical protein